MRYKDLKVLAGAGQGFSNKMALLKEIRYHFSKNTPITFMLQTPNVTLARKFVTGVRSETNIKPHKFFGSFLTVYRSRGVLCSLLLLPCGM